MKEFLVRNGVGSVENVLYADYESREDSIRFEDIVDGLNERFIERGIIGRDGRKRRDIDVIVHSTGGLVIRHWIWRYYRRDGNRIDECPVRRVVMLAPANFGSPLAHRGKSFLGSLVKGRRGLRDFLEVGRQILSGLELASPYQWWLAGRDLLDEEPHFHPERIQLTVLCGAEEYSGFRSLMSHEGTDGTVVISGAPLNSLKFVLDPRSPDSTAEKRDPYRWVELGNPTRAAFGVLPGHDHGSVVDAFGESDAEDRPLCQYVLRALRSRGPQDFEELEKELREVTGTTFGPGSGRKAYQQFLVRAVDDHGAAIDDFTLEFSVHKAEKVSESGRMRRVRSSAEEDALSERATKLIAREFHRHTEVPSHRRFLVDPVEVTQFLESARQRLGGEVALSLTIHVPAVDRGIRYDTSNLQAVALYPAEPADKNGNGTPTFFFPNTTTLLEIVVDRVNDYVFLGPRARDA